MTRAHLILQRADIWVPTQKAALMVGRGMRWIQENKHMFGKYGFRRKGPRSLEFELSAVLKVEQKINQNKEVS